MIPRCPHCQHLVWPWQARMPLRSEAIHVACSPARAPRPYAPPLPEMSLAWAIRTPWPAEAEPEVHAARAPGALRVTFEELARVMRAGEKEGG